MLQKVRTSLFFSVYILILDFMDFRELKKVSLSLSGTSPPPSPPPPPITSTRSLLRLVAQPEDSSQSESSSFSGDNPVDGGDSGLKGNSCEEDEEGDLDYHIGLVMKERCT